MDPAHSRPDDLVPPMTNDQDALGDRASVDDFTSLKDACAAQDKLYRNHSVQLVKLQSEFHEMQLTLQKPAVLGPEVRDLYSSVAQLKGMVANLTIKVHALKNTAPNARLAQLQSDWQPTERPAQPELPKSDWQLNGNPGVTSPMPTTPPMPTTSPTPTTLTEASDFWLAVRKTDGDVEALADKLLLEQRTHLIEALKSVVNIDKRLTKAVPLVEGAGVLTASSDLIAVESNIENDLIEKEPVETPVKFKFDTEKVPLELLERFRFRLASIK